MRIGVLTGGGDCPGLNAVIRAVVRRGTNELGMSFVGFRDAWRGVMERDVVPLDISKVRGTLPKGGTILGTSRANPYLTEGGVDAIRETVKELQIDGLIVIGGEGSMTLSHRLIEEIGLKVIGVPKTIDNDIVGTDRTFGFDTAVHVASEAIDRLHTTTESHHRVAIVEVMGRSVGWIAVHAGLAGGANGILIPEVPLDAELWERLNGWITSRFEAHYSPIIVVAEGVQPEDGLLTMAPTRLDDLGRPRYGGVGQAIAAELEAQHGYEVRTTTLGYVQRGGTPTAYDRVLATRFGLNAVLAAHEGDWGQMVTLKNSDIKRVPIAEVAGQVRSVPRSLYDEASVFFG